MMDLFDDIDEAFEPFFDTDIAVHAQGSRQTTVKCCVMDDSLADEVGDSMVDTAQRSVRLLFKNSDWKFVKPLRRGDKLVSKDGAVYAVSSSELDKVLGWVVKARLA